MDTSMSAYLSGAAYPRTHPYSTQLETVGTLVSCSGGGQLSLSPHTLGHHSPQGGSLTHGTDVSSGQRDGGYLTSVRHLQHYHNNYNSYMQGGGQRCDGDGGGTQHLYPSFPSYDRLDVGPVSSCSAMASDPSHNQHSPHLGTDYFRPPSVKSTKLSLPPTPESTSGVSLITMSQHSCRVVASANSIINHTNTQTSCTPFSSAPSSNINSHHSLRQQQSPPQQKHELLGHQHPHRLLNVTHTQTASADNSGSKEPLAAGAVRFTGCSRGNGTRKYENGDSLSDVSQPGTPIPTPITGHPRPADCPGIRADVGEGDTDIEGDCENKEDNLSGGNEEGSSAQAPIYPWMRSQYGKQFLKSFFF